VNENEKKTDMSIVQTKRKLSRILEVINQSMVYVNKDIWQYTYICIVHHVYLNTIVSKFLTLQ
jgi:hypothetical protein